ncbi:MAG: serine/threonine protein kinase [Chloroflexi bacterium]|nr:MAG: serine/threonine protein kinase [Chloroflexota bacterium]
MTDFGQDGDQTSDDEMPPTPGEQQVPPPSVIQQPAPPPPGQPPPHYSGPPANASPPPRPQSTFPGQDSATMRLIPTGISPAEPADGGERRIGKYIVKRELGRGGMGAVYLAVQPGLGREVAIKELVPSAAADPTALKRFLQEAQVMARTSHPNLVQVHDLEQIGAANYIVLEFVRGKSLRDWLNKGEIPLPQVFAVMHGVLQALDYAHRHAIVPGSTATKTGTTVGTPQYMSPEQVASSKVDGRSDLYSAGIVFYELVVGQPPFTASEADGPFTLMAKHGQAPPKPPSVSKPGLDMRLEEVILKSLSKRPEDRYQNGQEFDEAMARIADRLCPGWQRSLEPGADLSRMVPGAAGNALPGGTLPSMTMPAGSPPPIQAVYNPTPPVKPVVKKAASAGCMSLLVLALASAPALALLVAQLH